MNDTASSTQAMVDCLRDKYRSSIQMNEDIHDAVADGRIPPLDGNREQHARFTLRSVYEAQSAGAVRDDHRGAPRHRRADGRHRRAAAAHPRRTVPVARPTRFPGQPRRE
ncbi:hypothetical protein GCM10010195_65700 [Kitasatospora griseola]|nr:hypothetical protein GCM10010195_65700 [Kitasatospora griseola]